MSAYECDACGETFDTLSSLRIHQQDAGHEAAGHSKYADGALHVALTWASPENPPGSAAQAIRGHVRGLEAAGHGVDLFYGAALNALPERAEEYDAIIWPSNLYNTRQLKDADGTHRHFHFIGVDEPGNEVAFREAIAAADTYSAVDPNCTRFFCERFDVDPSEVAIIPNAPNTDVFRPIEAPEDGYALAPKTGAPQKEGHTLVELAKATPNTRYETHTDSPKELEDAPFNLRVRPPVPWSRMPGRYRDASFVVNPSRNEGLPNVAYEAFLSRRAYVSRPEAIGRIQTLPKDLIGNVEFGTSAEWFDDAYGDCYNQGDHYLIGGSEEGSLSTLSREMGLDPARRDEIAEAGRAWAAELSDRWSWMRVAEVMVETIEDG